MAKVLDYIFGVSEFDLQSLNYVYFRNNTVEKGMNPPPNYGLNNITTVLLQG